MAHILVVEDDRIINELIVRNLKLVGHTYSQAYNGREAIQIASNSSIDLVLLDIMLPELDGFEIIRELLPTPVIFLTAKDGLNDKLKGLSLGADDYIVKPFEMLELLARIEVVLRRTHKNNKSFILDNVVVDFMSRTVTKDGIKVDLLPQEFSLLEALIINKNIALSREKLLELAWGYDYLGETRTVDTHIQKIRSKLGWENKIKTLYKLGYRLEVQG